LSPSITFSYARIAMLGSRKALRQAHQLTRSPSWNVSSRSSEMAPWQRPKLNVDAECGNSQMSGSASLMERAYRRSRSRGRTHFAWSITSLYLQQVH